MTRFFQGSLTMVKRGHTKFVVQEETSVIRNEWSRLPVEKKELNLEIVLKCGQSFRWTRSDDEWIGVLKGHLYILKQTETYLLFKVLPGDNYSYPFFMRLYSTEKMYLIAIPYFRPERRTSSTNFGGLLSATGSVRVAFQPSSPYFISLILH